MNSNRHGILCQNSVLTQSKLVGGRGQQEGFKSDIQENFTGDIYRRT